MSDPKFTYEKLIKDKQLRAEFFRIYDLIINDLMRGGHIQAARTRALHGRAIAHDSKRHSALRCQTW